jgi:colanic acid/amylovoran biosynthesis protein
MPRSEAQRKHEQYVTAIHDLIDYVIDVLDGHIVVVNHVLSQDFARSDKAVVNSIQERAGSKKRLTVLDVVDPTVLPSVYGQLDLLVGSRMHSNIFALSAGVPVLAIAYLPKTEAMMSSLGLEEFTLKIESITSDNLIKRFDELWTQRHQVRTNLHSRLELVKEAASLNVTMLAQVVERARAQSGAVS